MLQDMANTFSRNRIDRYIDLSYVSFVDGKYPALNHLCYAECSRFHCFALNALSESDYHPQELKNDAFKKIIQI